MARATETLRGQFWAGRTIRRNVLFVTFVAGAPLACFIAFWGPSPDAAPRLAVLAAAAIFAAAIATRWSVRVAGFLGALSEASAAWQAGELRHRIPVRPGWCTEFQRLAAVQNVMADRLDHLYSRELEIAHALQHLLVSPLPSAHGSLLIADHYRAGNPSADIGGDFYSLFTLPDGRVGLLFGDIMGQGLEAAVRIAALRYALEAYAGDAVPPAQVMAQANRIVSQQAGDALVTLIFVAIDLTSGLVEWINAGHEPPLLYSCADEIWIPLTEPQPVLGLIPGVAYSSHQFYMAPADMLLLYTDGVASVAPRRGGWSTADLVREAGDPGQPASLVDFIARRLPAGEDDAAIVAIQFRGTRVPIERTIDDPVAQADSQMTGLTLERRRFILLSTIMHSIQHLTEKILRRSQRRYAA